MKNTKFVTVKGINFEEADFTPVHNGMRELSDLYKKPSSTKQDVFNYWENKLEYIYGLTGNLYMFQIYGCIRDEDGVLRDVKITPFHNFIERS